MPSPTRSGLQVVVLAAGKGVRLRSPHPKVMHRLCGRPLIGWAAGAAAALEPERVVVVAPPSAEAVVEAAARVLPGVRVEGVVQAEPRGTGDALAAALPALDLGRGTVVVLYGDMPLLRASSLAELLAARGRAGDGGSALLSTRLADPRGYGRVVRDGSGRFQRIVEERDATPEERRLDEINVGVYAFPADRLGLDLPLLTRDNAQGEYYLTDLLGLATDEGRAVEACEVPDWEECLGVNTLSQLADARSVMQMRILEQHMAAGVRIEDPATTYVDDGVEIGEGTHILPCTVIHGGVVIGRGCEVGPFAQLRPGTVLEDGAEVGNFTECKNTRLGRGSKAKHLTYLGDADVGSRVNIGAGTIFANYDGSAKHATRVGDRAFLGSGTIVVAPNEIPEGVVTGAGAVVTKSARMQPFETWVGLPARKHATHEPSPGRTD